MFGAWTHSQANVFPRRRSLAANLLRAQLLLPGRPAPGAVTPAGSTLPTPSLSESKPDCRFRKKEPKAPFSERPLLHVSDSSYSDWGKKEKNVPAACVRRETGKPQASGAPSSKAVLRPAFPKPPSSGDGLTSLRARRSSLLPEELRTRGSGCRSEEASALGELAASWERQDHKQQILTHDPKQQREGYITEF